MVYFFLVSYIFLIKLIKFSSCSSNFFKNNFEKQNNPSHYKSDNDEQDSFLIRVADCYRKYHANFSDINSIKCFLNATKNAPNDLEIILKSKYFFTILNDAFANMTFKYPENKEFLFRILKVFQESIKNKTKLIDYFYQALTENNNGSYLADYIINILDDANTKPINHTIILGNLSLIFQNKGVLNIYDYLMANHTDIIFAIVEFCVRTTDNFKKIYDIAMHQLSAYKQQALIFIFDIVKNIFDRAKLINITAEFLINYKDAIPGIKVLFKNETLISVLKGLVNNGTILDTFRQTFLTYPEFLDFFFELANYTEIVRDGAQIVININDNVFLFENIPPFFEKISKLSPIYLKKLTTCIMIFVREMTGGDEFIGLTINEAQRTIKDWILNDADLYNNISDSCLDLFNQTFFNGNSSWNEIFQFYFKKFLFDSPMNRGDFLAFDNCMDYYDSDEIIQNISYYIEPVFVIGIIDNPINKKIFKNTTFYEKYYYIANHCFPYGYKNKYNLTKSNAMCTEDDYKLVIKIIIQVLTNVNNTNFDVILLHNSNSQLDSSDHLTSLISLLVLAIPILIKIALMISKFIIKRKIKKAEKINKLIDSDKKEKKANKFKSNKDIKSSANKKKDFPKWYILLNEFFNFTKNGKEMFNFDLNNTNFNNINGITYIKGLIGLSIILTLFGLTFYVLINLPFKDYGSWHFFRTIQSFTFVLIFIGYRYSPRVLFSCSGYILIYKYLCYIEQEKGLYFLKFLYLQSYRYLLLYLVLIMYRYSIHEIIFLFRSSKRPTWKLFEYYINKEKNFLTNSMTLLFNTGKTDLDGDESKQNLIYHFFMPINEVFFFIFGIILISLGYKYKLRIDYIILGIIGTIFLLKAFLYSIYIYGEKNMYTTTDYYNFEFGIHFLHPFYNLSFFLIGMYFGLINYAVQKGITDLYADTNYKNIFFLKESNPDLQPESIEKQNDSENSELEINKSNYSQKLLNSNSENNNETYEIHKERMIENDINKGDNEKLEKIMANEQDSSTNGTNKRQYFDQIKRMPFLITPILFFNLNKKNKDRSCYNLLILLAFVIMILLSYSKTLALYTTSFLDENLENEEYNKRLSFEKVISNGFLNVIYLLDVEIVVFLSQWCILVLFFKEANIIRGFCNSIYWSFFVKSYFPFLLLSIPIMLCIFYETETVIKFHIYNIILYSLINFIFIFIFIIIFYSIYELPLKNIFKFFLKGNELIEENDDSDDSGEEENENEENLENYEDEEIKSLKV